MKAVEPLIFAFCVLFSVSIDFFQASSALAVEEKILPSGENLLADGLPKILLSRVADVDVYSDFRSASLYSWHPVKREMLIGTRFSDVTHIHHVRMPGGARTQLTFRREAATSASFEPVNGDYFIYSRDSNGSENFQKYRFDMATSKTVLLTDGKSRNTGLAWSTRGERIAFTSNKRNGKDMDVWIMNPLKPAEARLLLECEGGGFSAQDWSPDDKTILLSESLSINETYFWLLDVESGKKTPLIARAANVEPVAYSGGVFSRDGLGIFSATDKDSGAWNMATNAIRR